jgi:hypothetical protein
MKHLILVAALVLGAVGFANAGELDNDANVANQQSIQGTVVVRVDTRSNAASVLKTDLTMASQDQAQALAQTGTFQAVPAANVRTELDNDGGTSSWYFFRGPGFNYGYMNWYGNWYQPCYTYNYGFYNYYYYANYWW